MILIITTGFSYEHKTYELESGNRSLSAININSVNEEEYEEIQAVEIFIEEKTSIFIKENKVAIEEEKKSNVVIEEEKESNVALVEEKKNNVNITKHPFEITNLTEVQFNKILEGTGLEGQGAAYKKLEEEHNINGVYAISVAFLESGYGKHKAGKNNFYGMKGNKGWMSFKTVEDNILYFGELMNRDLYKDKSIEKIAKIYCPPSYKSWVNKVHNIIEGNFKKI